MTAAMKENHKDVKAEIASQIPTFYMRYEDLKVDPEPVLKDLFKFLLNVDSLEDTLCAKKIKEVTKTGFTDKIAY